MTTGDSAGSLAHPALIIIGPSGSGKTTIVETLQREGILALLPTWTDRPIRPGEVGGEHRFVTAAELDAAHAKGVFLHAPIALFGLEYRYALPALTDVADARVPCLMLRAAVRPLAEKYVPHSLIYQIEAPKTRVAKVLQERSKQGDVLGNRLSAYDAEVAAGRQWASRIFVNDDLDTTAARLSAAIRQDFFKGEPV